MVLVRPWLDAHPGSGCCSADPRGSIDGSLAAAVPVEHGAATRILAAAYLRLRDRFPDVDVQIVSASNTAYLLPATYAAARRRGGVLASLRACLRAPTAGALLLDGERLGDVTDLGPDGVAVAVATRLER